MGSIIITIKMPRELLSAIDRLAEERGVSRSKVIKDILRLYLKCRGRLPTKRKYRIHRIVLE